MNDIERKLNNAIATSTTRIENKQKELEGLASFNSLLSDIQECLIYLEAIHGDNYITSSVLLALEDMNSATSRALSNNNYSKEINLLLNTIKCLLKAILNHEK